MTKLKLLIIICEENCEKKIKNIYLKNNIFMKFLIKGNGTASSSILEYFGLLETKKDIHLSIIPDYLEAKILNQINKNLNINDLGLGIAFCISLTSANKYLLNGFENKKDIKENEMMKEVKNHLIITIVLEGHLEQVMSAAKKMGAQGGTVIRGHGLGNKDAVKLFGFEIEPGREIVLNVVDTKIKKQVMEEITKTVGIKTPGKGICIALPVDAVTGMTDIDK